MWHESRKWMGPLFFCSLQSILEFLFAVDKMQVLVHAVSIWYQGLDQTDKTRGWNNEGLLSVCVCFFRVFHLPKLVRLRKWNGDEKKLSWQEWPLFECWEYRESIFAEQENCPYAYEQVIHLSLLLIFNMVTWLVFFFYLLCLLGSSAGWIWYSKRYSNSVHEM